jgi:hypothetical protein
MLCNISAYHGGVIGASGVLGCAAASLDKMYDFSKGGAADILKGHFDHEVLF